MNARDDLLMTILECGSMDLDILDDVGYDLGEIVRDLIDMGLKPTLNAITNAIFIKGRHELQEAIEEKVLEKKDLQGKTDDTDEGEKEYDSLQEEIDVLESLNPDRDMNWYCNWLDTSCWFSENEAVYWKYLANEIRRIEDNMGFTF